MGLVFRSGAFLIALGLGLLGVYMFAKSMQGKKYIDRKHFPFLALIIGAMLFLWKAPTMAVFSTIGVPFTNYELDTAQIITGITFAAACVTLWQAYKGKI